MRGIRLEMVKDDETPNSDATNSDDEKASQVSVAKDPGYQIYPYPQNWFAHLELYCSKVYNFLMQMSLSHKMPKSP